VGLAPDAAVFFLLVQHLEFTLDTEGSEGPEKKPLTNEEISKQLERLIQDKAENQRIIDWVEVGGLPDAVRVGLCDSADGSLT
jgi:hypothetical protein